MVTSPSILIAITNYDFSTDASVLKSTLSQFASTILIDASSPTPPPDADISIPNTYYTGLWDAAVREAISRNAEWLFFIASDVRISHPSLLISCANEATQDSRIGIYTPSVTRDSRCAYAATRNALTATIRQCSVAEGFCFLARTSLLKALYPVGDKNRYGWSIDKLTSHKSRDLGLLTVVDDRVSVFHPQSLPHHTVDTAAADTEGCRYLATYGVSGESVQEALALDVELSRVHKPVLPARTSTLDLGCGKFPRNPFHATATFGIDVRPLSLPGIIEVKVADLGSEPIPYADASFDYITAFDFFEHVPRIIYCPRKRNAFVELMSEVYRCLRPGGLLLSLTPAFPNKQAFQDPTHVNIITEDTFPNYFDDQNRWAGMYGFTGSFRIEHQTWQDEGKLLSVLRKVPPKA